MKVVENVKIGYKDYSVKFFEHLDDGSRCLFGDVNFDDQLIRINSSFSTDQRRCTFLHEMIHAIDNMYEIGLTEEQVMKLGKWLYATIKDNPEMFETE